MSAFPVKEVTPQFPPSGRDGGQRPVKVVPSVSNTKTEIDVAVALNPVTGKSTGIGNLAPSGPEILELEGLTLCASEPCRLYFSIQDTALGGAGVPLFQSSIQVAANIPSYLPINTIMRSGMSSALYINKVFSESTPLTVVTGLNGTSSTSGGTLAAASYFARVTAINAQGRETDASNVLTRTTTGSTSSINYTWTLQPQAAKYRVYIGPSTTTYAGYIETTGNVNNILYTGQTLQLGTPPAQNNTDIIVYTSMATHGNYRTDYYHNDEVKRVMRWIGDSITAGTGPTDYTLMYQMLFWNECRKRGVNVGYDLRGIAGSTTTTHRTRVLSGFYDTSDPIAPIYALGTNNAIQSNTVEDTANDMKDFLTRSLTDPYNKKSPVLCVTPLPLNDNTAEAKAALIRTAFATVVSDLKIAYPSLADYIYIIDMTNAFDRTNLTNYKDSDGIHPSDAACKSIFDNKIVPFLNSSEGVRYLSQM